jgi:hypothetical protein
MRLKPLIALCALAFTGTSFADEGMWQPHQLPELESVLKAKALEIDAKSISK